MIRRPSPAADRCCRRDPEIEVVGERADPPEARQKIKALNPDVITLDIEMPNMNGLEFLEKIMRLRPMPVIMVSTLTRRGADTTLAALEIGAFDCIAKPTENVAATRGRRRRSSWPRSRRRRAPACARCGAPRRAGAGPCGDFGRPTASSPSAPRPAASRR